MILFFLCRKISPSIGPFEKKNFNKVALRLKLDTENTNEKKQGWSCSGRNKCYLIQYFQRHCLFHQVVTNCGVCNNRWSSTSFLYSSKFACQFLSFAHFLKMFFYHSVLFFLFSFSLLSFNSSIYSSSTIWKRDAIVTEKKNIPSTAWSVLVFLMCI